jgi:hypothetical protein
MLPYPQAANDDQEAPWRGDLAASVLASAEAALWIIGVARGTGEIEEMCITEQPQAYLFALRAQPAPDLWEAWESLNVTLWQANVCLAEHRFSDGVWRHRSAEDDHWTVTAHLTLLRG